MFLEQRAVGHAADLGGAASSPLRVPKIFNLRTDPYERADITSNTYYDWMLDHVYLLVPAQAGVAEFLGDLQGVPAAAEGGELQPRSGNGQDDGVGRRRRPLSPVGTSPRTGVIRPRRAAAP